MLCQIVKPCKAFENTFDNLYHLSIERWFCGGNFLYPKEAISDRPVPKQNMILQGVYDFNGMSFFKQLFEKKKNQRF